jgi:cell division protein ZipA
MMEIQARIVLLIMGVIILSGVAYDFMRRRNTKRVRIDLKEDQDDILLKKQNDFVEEEPETIEDVYQHIDMDMDFALPDDAPLLDLSTEQVEEYPPVNVMTITILARKTEGFNGAELYRALNKAGCHYDNKVFARYAGDNGDGEPLFFIVQAVEPGTFDIERLPDITVPGITFIMQPDQVDDKEAALDQMVRVAKQLAFVLNGELLDHQRQPLTLESIAKYQAQIRAE